MSKTTILYGPIEKNSKLVGAKLYKESDGYYYMSLDYEYEATDGKHLLRIPKVDFPFSTGCIPIIRYSEVIDTVSDGFEIPSTEYNVNSLCQVRAWPSTTKDPKTGMLCKDTCMTNYLTEPAVKKMTIGEIEKALGYKIEIVNKKED